MQTPEYKRLVLALEELGYKGHVPEVKNISLGRYEVSVNGDYIGIWDQDRETFVD
jgi:hypothetical protein